MIKRTVAQVNFSSESGFTSGTKSTPLFFIVIQNSTTAYRRQRIRRKIIRIFDELLQNLSNNKKGDSSNAL